eukprot:CAMPEP_0194261298 /NCGR_PEP_ID=MMETSP0158-20130606/45954_1 /TAXON_ID=33649 /ORGANISM="Thalassionema nitzschioides, Strain L26-B" /LENGTH=511 /DNA_ID=CAMNT_0039001415 /DNA_START=84 /DNA_END=1618 /DNA_ORIENTATION=-
MMILTVILIAAASSCCYAIRTDKHCTILKTKIVNEDDNGQLYSSESKCYCETSERSATRRGLRRNLSGEGRSIIAEMIDLDPSICDEAVSSETIVTSSDGFEWDSAANIISTPIGASIISHHGWKDLELFSQNDQHLIKTRHKTILIVRGKYIDQETTPSEDALRRDLLGVGGDGNTANLSSHYETCSNGKLSFGPVATGVDFNGYTSNNSVITVNFDDSSVTGNSHNTVRDAMLTELGTNPESKADHIVLCIPPGTGDSWVAYSYVNHWLSVYNDDWCDNPFALIRELGHNLNLAESVSMDSSPDQSDIMGLPYSFSPSEICFNGAKYVSNGLVLRSSVSMDSSSDIMGLPYSFSPSEICFNGPNTYQMGWYSDRHVDFTSRNLIDTEVSLIGFVDLDKSDESMIIRLSSSSGIDYYVHFNHRADYGSDEGGDQVLIASKDTLPLDYGQSILLVKLDAGEEYIIPNFGRSGDLKIQVTELGSNPRKARVSIKTKLNSEDTVASSSIFWDR